MKKKYKCEIDCAACAQKVEDAVKKIDGVNDVRVNFMMQKFTLDADDARYDDILQSRDLIIQQYIIRRFSVEI